jgi:hypothetical protein
MECYIASRWESEFRLNSDPFQPSMAINIEHIVIDVRSGKFYIGNLFEEILTKSTTAAFVQN